MTSDRITTPDDPALTQLCEFLAARAGTLDQPGREPQQLWPGAQLRALAAAGVHAWFVPRDKGGTDWSEADQLRGYLALSEACLTTAFILTQRAGAVRRIADLALPALAANLLPGFIDGTLFATVGISHLTTSRRHLAQPSLLAEPVEQGWILTGGAPWVTGALAADWIVTGATQPDGQQLLFALPTELPGIIPQTPMRLLALTSSCTGEVRYYQVCAPREFMLAGPAENVMSGQAGAKTGGLTTSALALGHAAASIAVIASEAVERRDLELIAAELNREQTELVERLLALANGDEVCPPGELRAKANSLALRSAQAALAAAKGHGFVQGHIAERLCREALFFLVWSCPQPVVAANLCELAGLA